MPARRWVNSASYSEPVLLGGCSRHHLMMMNCEEVRVQKDKVVNVPFVTYFLLFSCKKYKIIRHENHVIHE